MPQQSLESSPANAMVSGSFNMSCANFMRFTYCWWRKLSFVMFDRNIFLYKNLFTWWGLIILRPEVAESCEDICQLRAYPIYNYTLCRFFTSIWTKKNPPGKSNPYHPLGLGVDLHQRAKRHKHLDYKCLTHLF